MLSEEALAKAIADEAWSDTVSAVATLLGSTNLVSPSKTAKPVGALSEDLHERVVRRLS